jgi:hypothetical protein
MNALCAIDNGLLSPNGLLTPEPPTNLAVNYTISIPLDSDPDLVFHYPFNQNILDYPGTNPTTGISDATIYGDSSKIYLSSDYSIFSNGTSLYSDSTTNADYFQIDNENASIQNTNGYTFSYWIYLMKTPLTTIGDTIYSMKRDGTEHTYRMHINSTNQLVIYYRNNSSTTVNITISNKIVLYTWHHIVWTLSKNDRSNVYINGLQVVANNTTLNYISPMINNKRIFGDANGSNTPINGYMNDFRYYNRILDSAEVFQLYNIYSLKFNSGLQWQAFYGNQSINPKTEDFTNLPNGSISVWNSFQYNAYYSGGNNNTLFSTSSNLLTTINYTNDIALENNIFGFNTTTTGGNTDANAGINIGLLVNGFFRPDISGIWNFQLNTDDYGAFWINDGSGGASFWPPTNTNFDITTNNSTVTYNSTSLIAGTYYPFQITWSQGIGFSRLIFSFKYTSSATYITDGTGYFFSQKPTTPIYTDLSLVLYYPFDQNIYNYASGFPVLDSNYSPTFTNIAINNTTYKVGNGSLYKSSNSSTQYLLLNAIPQNTGGYSFAFWFYFTVTSAVGTIFSFGNTSKRIKMSYPSANGINLSIESTPSQSINTTYKPSLNTWNHYVWTLDTNSNSNFYINGVLQTGFPKTTITYSSFEMINPYNFILSDNTSSITSAVGYLDDFRYYNSILTPTTIASLSNNQVSNFPVFAETLNTGLLLYYPFDEDIYNYASGTGVDDATITGDYVSRNTDNYIVGSGSLYKSIASDNTSYFAAPALPANTGGYSFALWLYMTSYTTGVIFAFAQNLNANTDLNRISFTNIGTQMRFLCSNTSSSYLISQPPLNTWTHYVWTLDTGSNNCIYVNGSMLSGYPKVDSVNNYASFPMNYNWIFGNNYSAGSGSGQQGYVDDFRYYNRILTQSEVTQLYNMFIPSYPTTSYSMVLYYPFNRDISNYASGTPVTNGSIAGSTVSISRTKYATGNGSLYQSASNTDSYFSIPVLPPNTNGYTFALWLNITSYTTGMIFSFADILGAEPDRISFWNNNDTGVEVFRFLCSNGTNDGVTFSRPPLNSWNHYGLTLDTFGNTCVYINGVLSSYSGLNPYRSFTMNVNRIFGDTINSAGQQGYVDDFQYYDTVLTQDEIIALYETYNPSDVSANSLILYYPFNKDLLNYASGTGVTFGSKTGSGIDLNSSNYAIGSGSLYKSGSNDSSYFSPNALPPNTGGYTFALWVYFTNINTTGTLFSFASASNSTTRIYLRNTSTIIRIFCNNNQITGIPAPSQNNIWYHYTWTLDTNSNSNFYINGVLQSGFPSQTIPYASFPMEVNRIYGDTNGDNAGPGYIDDFRYYNAILNQTQVTELYNMKTDIPNTGTLSLKLYYPFDTDISNYASGIGNFDNSGSITGSVSLNNNIYAVGTGSLYNNLNTKTNYFRIRNIPINTAGYSFSFWMKKLNDSNYAIFAFSNSGTLVEQRILLWSGGGSINMFSRTSPLGNYTSNFTPTFNIWHHIVWTIQTDDLVRFYADGILIRTTQPTNFYRTFTSSSSIYLFQDFDNDINNMKGYIDDFRYYDGILSQAQVTDLYNSKNPYYLTLKLYYPFDTDISNYASGTGVTFGNIVGPTKVLLNYTNPIVGLGCLYQSTSNEDSYFNIPQIDPNLYGYSFSFWFYFTNLTTNGMIFSFTDDGINRIYLFNTGNSGDYTPVNNLRFYCNGETNNIGSIYPKLNTWYHYVWTLDTNSNNCIYINGVLQVIATTPTYASFTPDKNSILGDKPYLDNKGQRGYIDDFRYYDGILNQAQVTDLYNKKGLFHLKDLINTLSLLLYYPFNTDIKNYASGVGITTGTIVGTTVSLSNTNYIVGSGSLYQSASNITSYFKCESLVANKNGYSFSFWIYFTNNTTPGVIFSFANALNSEQRVYIFSDAAKNLIKLSLNNKYKELPVNSYNSLNTWYHYVWTLDTSGKSYFYVNGVLQANFADINHFSFAMNYNRILGSTFTGATDYGQQGYIDDFRYYDGILSPTQVSDLYNSKNTQNFDPNTDSALCIYYPFDISRNYIVNYAASVYGVVDASYASGAVVDYTTNNVGTGALKLLSASSQYVILNSNSIVKTTNFISPNGMTFSLWIKSNSTSSNAAIFYLANSDTDYIGLFINGSNSISCKVYNTNTLNSTVALSTNYNNNIWCHVVWTLGYSSSNTSRWNIYIDGIMVSDTYINYYPIISTPKTTSRLGSDGGSIYYNGWIDDFRVYQRVLNQLEITQLYNYRDTSAKFPTLNANAAIFSWTPPERKNGVSYNYYYTDNTLITTNTILSDNRYTSGLQWKAFYGNSGNAGSYLGYNGTTYSTTKYTTFQNNSEFNNNSNTSSSGLSTLLTEINFDNNITASGNRFGYSVGQTHISLIISGYFKPNQTGTWTFRFANYVNPTYIANDDVSVFWIDDGKTANGTTTHWPPTDTNYNSRINYTDDANPLYDTATLTAGVYYPIQISWGQSTGGNILCVGFGLQNTTLITNGTGFFFSYLNPSITLSTTTSIANYKTQYYPGLQWEAFYGIMNNSTTVSISPTFNSFQTISRYSRVENTLSSTSSNVLTYIDYNININKIAAPGNMFGFSNTGTDGEYGNYISLVVTGFFLPNQTGNWNFKFANSVFSNDDITTFWIGDSSGDRNHWPPSDTNYNLSYSYAQGSFIYTTTLTSGVYYPIQIVWSQYSGQSGFGFQFQGPGMGSYVYNGAGYFFYSVSVPIITNTKATNALIPEINIDNSNSYYVNSQRANKQSVYSNITI